MIEFNSNRFVKTLEQCQVKFKLIADQNPPKIGLIWQSFEKTIKSYREQGYLTVAFIGEYSAGKSTIIAALTGLKDIKISADIATDVTTEYDWNGIKIIDTPGLYTDHKEHDQITLAAINRADLIVFCMTHSLLDSITAENFKDLAFKYNYKNKMMLVLNKLSSEAGNDDQKIDSYKVSLKKALEPEQLDFFPMAFIDALDYLNGQKGKDEELIKISRFEMFINTLNQFTADKKIYGKIDTPIRILNASLDEAVQAIIRDETTDNTKLELLRQLSKITQKERFHLESAVAGIILDLNSKIINMSGDLTSILGSDENFENKCKNVEHEIKKLSEDASEQVQDVVNKSMLNLKEEYKTIFNGDLFKQYICDVDSQIHVKHDGFSEDNTIKDFRSKFSNFQNITETISKTIGNINIHDVVYNVGKFFGAKFKPWQAVNLAKNIGNVMKCAGPVLSIIFILIDAKDVQKDNENAKALSQARKDISAMFLGIANDMEKAFKKQLEEVFQNHFKPLEDEIAKARNIEEQDISKTNDIVKDLVCIRGELSNLLMQID